MVREFRKQRKHAASLTVSWNPCRVPVSRVAHVYTCTHTMLGYTCTHTWMHSQKGQVSTFFPSCGSIVRNSAGVPNNTADITLQYKGTSNLSAAKESKTRGGGERKVRIQKYFLQDLLGQPIYYRRTMSTVTILYSSWN